MSEGIISNLSNFLETNFRIGPVWAKALATTMMSGFLGRFYIIDRKGPVKANLYFLRLAPTGDDKTPPLSYIRQLTNRINPFILCPPRFTPQGFASHVRGNSKKNKKPHYVNVIIRDEMSRLLAEYKGETYMMTMLQFLSELWDGYIEGNATRKYGYEGGITCYATLHSASSYYFFNLLGDEFFTQGLGNRFLPIPESNPKPLREDEDEFFVDVWEESQNNFMKAFNAKIDLLKDLDASVELDKDAKTIYVNFEYGIRKRVFGDNSILSGWLKKQNLNVLKLALNYCASHFEGGHKYLVISEHDMAEAIVDVRNFEQMFVETLRLWKQHRTTKQMDEVNIEREKVFAIVSDPKNYDFETLVTETRITAHTGMEKQKIARILADLQTLKRVEIIQGTKLKEMWTKKGPKPKYAVRVVNDEITINK